MRNTPDRKAPKALKTVKRRAPIHFVNSVTIYDDKIVITFNYKDGQKTLPITALKSSDTDSSGVPKVLEIV